MNICDDIITKININELNLVQKKYPDNEQKYFNYKFEIPFKYRLAITYLSLDKISKKEIIDIGCGPGWFPFIAKYFDHNVKCCDMSGTSHLEMYEDILHVLKLKKNYSFRIKAQQKIPSEIGRYDIITCLGAMFHHKWTINDWYFFLDDLIKNHCKYNSECCIFFQVNRNSAWEILEKDNIYSSKKEIKEWKFFENHILRIKIRI